MHTFFSQNVDGAMPNGFTDYASDLRQQLNYSINDFPANNIHPVKSGSTVAITTNGDVVTTDLSFIEPKRSTATGINYNLNAQADFLYAC
jgi:hypothetical protein